MATEIPLKNHRDARIGVNSQVVAQGNCTMGQQTTKWAYIDALKVQAFVIKRRSQNLRMDWVFEPKSKWKTWCHQIEFGNETRIISKKEKPRKETETENKAAVSNQYHHHLYFQAPEGNLSEWESLKCSVLLFLVAGDLEELLNPVSIAPCTFFA